MNMLNVLVSLITDDNDFQLEQAASAQAAAVQLGARVQIIYSDNDAVQQTQQILSYIQDPSKRPDAILADAEWQAQYLPAIADDASHV